MPPLPPTAKPNDTIPDAEAILTTYLRTLPPSINLTSEDQSLLRSFLEALCNHDKNNPDTPVPVPTLLTTSTPKSYHAGTGKTQTQALAHAIERAKQEVIFVTCFWAPSESLVLLSAALRELSTRALARNVRVRVRLCFSSMSAWQRAVSPPRGKVWERLEDLGLPGRGELSGLDILVKSLFFPPFSVLHGKYCVVDRKLVWIGSGNVSWECWGEGCGSFEGEGFVRSVLEYYRVIWEESSVELPALPFLEEEGMEEHEVEEVEEGEKDLNVLDEIKEYPTILLPNPHHRNPHFSLRSSIQSLTSHLPCLRARRSPSHLQTPPPPNTPQNTFLLTLLSHAKTSITIHTPNLTSRPLLSALLSAASRNVHITIITCRNMMRMEQLVTTPFSTTESCVDTLISSLPDLETGSGKVHLGYWRGRGEVKQWHVKASIVDDAWTVIGSANGDRASWWGSGEINVCVFGGGYAREVGGRLERWAVEAGGVEWVLGGRELGA